jgi:NOL1/NOP2/sun family putative RNA methylase
MKVYPEFKEKFIERYSKLTDFKKFKEYSTKEQDKSIRVNSLKITNSKLKSKLKDFKLRQIPWCKEGFFISGERTDLGNLPEHGLGYFYIQEASSMIPPLILKPKEGDLVLDMAAAPGSKTTQMAAIMKNKGLIVANDLDYKRIISLNSNLQRCGVTNTITTIMEGRFFKNFQFDKILLDAPCSGTGTIRKSPNTISEWSDNIVNRLYGIQKQLINTAFENLKKGGTLVYSTCTLEPKEDENVVSKLLDKYDNAKVEKINLKNLNSSKPVLEFEGNQYNKEVKNCLRIWPQDNDSDGFFVAKIKKV